MPTPGLHPLDSAVLVCYLLGIMIAGLWVSRRVSGAQEFFMPRRFGKGMMMMHAFGTGTASDQAVTVAAATFRSGLSGIWYQWLWLFATPFYWLIAPIFRRFRAITTADVYELRFDRSVAMLFAVVGIANMCVKIGVMLVGAGALIQSGTGGAIATDLAIIGLTLMFVVYGAAGGLSAAIVTDYLQGLLTIVLSVMLLPPLFAAVGGMSGVRESVHDPALLSLVAPGKIGLFFVVMMAIQALVGIVAQPFIMGVCAAGRTEWEGRIGFVGGNLIKRLCTIAWCLTGIAAVAWYLQRGIDLSALSPEQLKATADGVYGEIAHAFLPELMPGLLGLFLAAILAGVMSSCDSFMISSAGLFTENLYRPWRPDRSDHHYLWVGRGAALAVVAGGLLFAFWVPNLIEALEIWFMIAPMMGIVFWIALFWRPMTVAGAWAATLTGFTAWWITVQSWFIDALVAAEWAARWHLIWWEDGAAEVYLPWQIVIYLAAATTAGVIVSLVTPRVSAEKLDRFYMLTRTPVVPGERLEQPCVLPAGTPIPERPLWVDWGGVEIPRPSRASVIGFGVVWLWVGVLIGGFVLLVV